VIKRRGQIIDRSLWPFKKRWQTAAVHARRTVHAREKGRETFADVEADAFDGLLVEYVVSRKAQAIVRGLARGVGF